MRLGRVAALPPGPEAEAMELLEPEEAVEGNLRRREAGEAEAAAEEEAA